MKAVFRPVLAAAVLLTTTAVALAIAGAHPEGRITGGADYWTDGLRELINRDERIHGYFVNSEDQFLYAGDTESLNRFLKIYADLKDTRLKVVLHAGPAKAAAVGARGRPRQRDWGLYSAPRDWIKHSSKSDVTDDDPPLITRVDVWMGRAVKLDGLEIPAAVPVEVGKDVEPESEIRKFVEERRAKDVRP